MVSFPSSTVYLCTFPSLEEQRVIASVCSLGHSLLTTQANRGEECPRCYRRSVPKYPVEWHPCRHCQRYLDEHAATWCLFSPTQFSPYTREEMLSWRTA